MITMGMLRSLVTATITLAAACDVGSVLAHEGGGTDGGGSGSGSGSGMMDCLAVVSPELQTGHHAANGKTGDAGATAVSAHEGCMGQAGCHSTTAPGNVVDIWDYGGEAFTDSAGTTPAAGAHIILTAAGSPPMVQYMEVMQNGFFYMPAGTGFPKPSATQPITAAICMPGQKTAMATSLAAVQAGSGTDGNCSGTACHGPGQAGAYIFPTFQL
jgi:hypothetical protein